MEEKFMEKVGSSQQVVAAQPAPSAQQVVKRHHSKQGGRETKRVRHLNGAPPLTPLQQKLITQLQTVYPELSDFQGMLLRIEHIRMVGIKRSQDASVLRPSDGYPRMVFVTKTGFHVVQKAAGSGSYSTAYFTVEISFSGENPRNRVVKYSTESFKPERVLLDELSPASKTSNKIDHFIASYFVKGQGRYLGVFEPSDCDFTKIDYGTVRMPVSFICRQLIDVAEGIASFHRRDIILRDLKGANLLINVEGPGKVTDFGYLRKVRPEGMKHEATGTAYYIAPFIWDSILGQKYWDCPTGAPHEGGYQGKASDIFSLGRVIYMDVLARLVRSFGKKHQLEAVTIPFSATEVIPRKIEGKFTDDVLMGFERKYPGRVIRDACYRDRDVLYIFEDHEQMYQNVLHVINQFEGFVHEAELEKMRGLALLARDLQNPSKEGVLEMLGVDVENAGDFLVQGVIQRLQAISEPPYIRPLSFEGLTDVEDQEGLTELQGFDPLAFLLPQESAGTPAKGLFMSPLFGGGELPKLLDEFKNE